MPNESNQEKLRKRIRKEFVPENFDTIGPSNDSIIPKDFKMDRPLGNPFSAYQDTNQYRPEWLADFLNQHIFQSDKNRNLALMDLAEKYPETASWRNKMDKFNLFNILSGYSIPFFTGIK